ncbi:PfkB family carbohydrate kinase [Sphingomonas azotifigens]|uniref:PfkB family carbohydrate kinase n=1 Tax=Sphingomonas azotifigens TaxID=330920 RepID=UPI000A0133FB|nr:PfkB family carbohydrate kinase [Sphingomonas azotifigens]
MITDPDWHARSTDDCPVFVLASFVAACSVRVDRLPARGETLAADDFLLEAGGKGLNVAVALRRLGVAVDGLLAVGADWFGGLAAGVLATNDLPAAMLCRMPGRSGAGVGLIDRAGDTVIAVYPGANASLAAEDVVRCAGQIARARYVVAQFEIGDAPIAAAFAAAPQATRVLNPSPFRPILPAILADTDLLVVNETEADALAQSLGIDPDPDRRALATALFQAGVQMLVVTAGERDARLWQPGLAPILQPSFAVAAIDGIGAGDAFLAGLVAALAEGTPPAEALRLAAACGALAATRHGVLAALPTRAQRDGLVQTNVFASP